MSKTRLLMAAVLVMGSWLGVQGAESLADAVDSKTLKSMMDRLAKLEEKNAELERNARDATAANIERVARLEGKNSELERMANANRSTNIAVDEALAKEDQIQSQIAVKTCGQNLVIGGYLDTSYQYNFNRPSNGFNNFRLFDTDANGFNVHLAELTFDGLPTEPCHAGFRIDLGWGSDLRGIRTFDRSTCSACNSSSDFKQAYIEYIIPVGCAFSGGGNGIKVDMGKFVSWAGYETIEGADNFNSSRSLLFSYAIPFTHTGIRAQYDVFKCADSHLTVGAAITNGWDNTVDQNASKNYQIYSNWQPAKWIDTKFVGMIGNETVRDNRAIFLSSVDPVLAGSNALDALDPATPAFNDVHAGNTYLGLLDGGRVSRNFSPVKNSSPRVLLDFSMNFRPFCDDSLVLGLNADLGRDNGGKQWEGAAGYAKYQFARKWYVAARAEVFNDRDGFRTGIRQTMSEGTITIDYALTSALHSRLEFRHDNSNKGVFSDETYLHGGVFPNLNAPFPNKSQDTIMYSWLYKF